MTGAPGPGGQMASVVTSSKVFMQRVPVTNHQQTGHLIGLQSKLQRFWQCYHEAKSNEHMKSEQTNFNFTLTFIRRQDGKA